MAGEQPPTREFSDREAYDLCEDIRHAAELTEAAKRLNGLAQQATSQVSMRTMFRNLPFKLEITLPEGQEAYVVRDDDLIEEQPRTFLATELRSISEHGVEFFDGNDTYLRIKGYDFEVMPVLTEPPANDEYSP